MNTLLRREYLKQWRLIPKNRLKILSAKKKYRLKLYHPDVYEKQYGLPAIIRGRKQKSKKLIAGLKCNRCEILLRFAPKGNAYFCGDCLIRAINYTT